MSVRTVKYVDDRVIVASMSRSVRRRSADLVGYDSL